MANDTYDEKYTDPDLRRRLKAEIEQGDKGGKPGQWSARKSQLLVQEYERQGGGYTGDKDDAARSLEAWTDQQWQTQDGEAVAREGDETKLYLPKEAWDKLSVSEKREAEQRKQEASERGEQYVEYTPAVQRAYREATSEADKPTKQELYKRAQERDIDGRSTMTKDELIAALRQAEDE